MAVLMVVQLAFCAARVKAADVEVSPIPILLWPDAPTQLATIKNISDQSLRYQLSALTWDLPPDGDPKMTPTDDVIFFPPLVTLNPREEQVVRMGMAAPFGFSENTYMLVLDQLPSPPVPKSQLGPNQVAVQVNVLEKIAVPVFVEPASLRYAAAITDISLDRGMLSFLVKNDGNVRVSFGSGVGISGYGPGGNKVFSTTVLERFGRVVQGGHSRIYRSAIPKAECEQIKQFKIQFTYRQEVGKYDTKPSTVTQDFTPASGSCGR